jgi:hypothetical protein
MNLAKQHAEQKAAQEAVVVVTSRNNFLACIYFCTAIVCLLVSVTSHSAILPEERADVLYHSYDGGGVTIDGPSVLVRKNVAETFSFTGNYYVDMVTSASIDVVTTASEYTEERKEYSLGVDYLNDRTILSLNYSNSTESDYIADTVGLSLSQEFFGDLSTLTLGFALGDDVVKQTGAPDFEEEAERKRFSLGFSQILTKRFIAAISYESVFDEGFLNNPYRQVRVAAPVVGPTDRGFNYIPENYPSTRNSEALAVRGIYAINDRSSLRFEYRKYDDSWDVDSDNIELRYSRYLGNRWLVELRTRAYNQKEGAFFYQDLFNFTTDGTPEFYARDKELSEYSAQQFGLSVSYTIRSRYDFFNNSTLNFSWDRINYEYDNFRDLTVVTTAGEEPLYTLEADIIRIFYSAYF